MDERNDQRARRDGRAFQLELATRLVSAESTAAELAAAVGMTLMELAEWVAEPANARAVESLARLTQLRQRLLLERLREAAALRLYAIASSDDAGELARRACVDLLRADIPAPVRPVAGEEESPATCGAPSEEAILRTLELIGRDAS